MTDFDLIEQRLRATFQAVAQQPMAPLSVDDEPWRAGVAPVPTRRHPRPRVLLGAVAGLVIVALVGIGVAYGPRSATTTTSRAPTPPPSRVMHAVLAPVSPTSRAGLELAAATMTARLRSLGDHDTVTVRGGSIDVSGASISPSQLQRVAAQGAFEVRPVLCGAPAYVPAQPGIAAPTGSTLPACGAPYALSASNLAVNTSTGQPATIPADPFFAPYPSTTAQNDQPAAGVLLPVDPSAGAQQYPRFVLGPAELSGSDIASANARTDASIDAQIVTIALKPTTAAQWDMVAELNFHQYIALDLDGQVLSAPLIQPSATTFSSFRGQMQISGNFSVAEARGLAAVLGSGPLPTGLKLESMQTVSRSA